MLFSKIQPFIRYARFLRIDNLAQYPPFIPYDARFFYVTDGCGTIVVRGKRYTMLPGDLILINSGLEYYHEKPVKNVTYIAFNFDYTCNQSEISAPVSPDVKEIFDNNKIIEKVFFEDEKMLNDVVYLKNMQYVESKVVAIRKEYSKKLIFHEQKESILFAQVLIEIVRRLNSIVVSENKDIIEKIIDYIYENCAKNITNKDIGKKFGFHPNYVSLLIKSATGMPMHKYIMHARLSYSVELLYEGELNVVQIAQKCGFCDVFYFSRCFKNVFGVSPSKYKWK